MRLNMVDNHQIPPIQDELDWNTDAAWLDFILSLEPQIVALAVKYTRNESLRDDLMQNARIELLSVFPSQIDGYEAWMRRTIAEDDWQDLLYKYCIRVVRNDMLSTLNSHSQGNLYVGRTQVVEVVDGVGKTHRVKKESPARYVSLDTLMEEQGLQVSDKGELSWDHVNDMVYGEE